jgi:hypothetical protein
MAVSVGVTTHLGEVRFSQPIRTAAWPALEIALHIAELETD